MFAAWIGLAAVLLHAFVPLAGLAAFGASLSYAGHSHAAYDQAPERHAHAHHGHTENPRHALNEAPATPDTFCVGDCPCCSASYKIYILTPARLAWTLPDTCAGCGSAALPTPPYTYEPAQARLARAPPVAPAVK